MLDQTIQYYLRFWLGICRTSPAVSALRIMRYCLYYLFIILSHPQRAAPRPTSDTLARGTAVDREAAPAGATNGSITDSAVAGGAATGIVMSPQGYGILSGAKDSGGDIIFAGSYNTAVGAITPFGLTTLQRHAAYKAGSSAANSVGFIGDWTKAIVGTVQDITVDFSDQATINDGTKQVNLWQRNMFALRCEMEVGFIVEGADYFQKFTDTYP